MQKSQGELFNLRQVVELTGVSEFTLRGWEGRHKAFLPHRTETGRRLYSREDLEKIRLLSDLTRQGHRIGQLSHLCCKELQKLSEKSRPPTQVAAPLAKKDKALEKLIGKARSFEWGAVENLFQRKREALKPEDFIFHWILPALSEVASQVMQNHLSIAQEHILSSMIKEHLYSLQPKAKSDPQKNTRFRLLLATPEGDFHELGLLVAATLARLQRASFLYLGPNVPKTELCETALRYEATHVMLASTLLKSEGAKEDFLTVVNYFDRHMPKSITLWMAGRGALMNPVLLQRPSHCLGSFYEFSQLVKAELLP